MQAWMKEKCSTLVAPKDWQGVLSAPRLSCRPPSLLECGKVVSPKAHRSTCDPLRCTVAVTPTHFARVWVTDWWHGGHC